MADRNALFGLPARYYSTPPTLTDGQAAPLRVDVNGRLIVTDGSTGNVTGPGTPASSTDNAIVRWDGTGGSQIQNSLVTIDDNGKINGIAATTASASIGLATGVDPTSPAAGDIWYISGNFRGAMTAGAATNFIMSSGSQTLSGVKTFNGGLTMSAALTMTDANNIVLGTTTGTKIGTATTQKLGFFNATPVVQPTGTPANATDLTTVIALANSLKTSLIALGLIS